MRRRREKKRKVNSNNNKKKKDDSYIINKKHKKQNKLKRIHFLPFSVFAKKGEEEVMNDDSVIFTEPVSSDHPLKAHCHDYPYLK